MRSSILMSAAIAAVCAGGLAVGASPASAEGKHEIYGFVMIDAGYNDKAIDPQWFDTQRPTKLPSPTETEFGKDGSTFFSVRQTRFGMKSWLPTDLGELKTTFEFEMFGVGADAGQTTIRLRHAYGEIGKWGAGQYWSPFMDIDVFPNTVEYWGPNGMVFFRNVQFRYMPIQGDTRMTIALERPGASADGGIYSELIGGDIYPRYALPDLSAEYRVGRPWGYVELAGIVRQMEWQDLSPTPTDLSDKAVGWGLNLSSNLKPGDSDVIRLQVVYGEGIQNYMNDATVDIGTELNPGDPVQPVKGVPIPMTGVVAFLDHTWNEKMSSSIGYSMLDMDNTDGQSPSAFKKGQYILGNLLFTPAQNYMVGVEAGWIERENFSDGYKVDNVHVQVSAKYNFSFGAGN